MSDEEQESYYEMDLSDADSTAAIDLNAELYDRESDDESDDSDAELVSQFDSANTVSEYAICQRARYSQLPSSLQAPRVQRPPRLRSVCKLKLPAVSWCLRISSVQK